MLNLNGSLTKAGVKYSTLWSEDFTDESFKKNLQRWLEEGNVRAPRWSCREVETKLQVLTTDVAKVGEACAGTAAREGDHGGV